MFPVVVIGNGYGALIKGSFAGTPGLGIFRKWHDMAKAPNRREPGEDDTRAGWGTREDHPRRAACAAWMALTS